MTAAPRSLLSNTLAAGAATLWTALCTLGLLPVLIRLLGPERYGVWVLLGVLLVPGRGLTSLLDLGLQQSLIARVAAEPAAAPARLGAGLRMLVAVGVLAAVTLSLAAPALADLVAPRSQATETTAAVRLLAVQLVVDLPALGLAAGLLGLRRYELQRSLDAARVTLTTAAWISAAALGGGLTALAAVSLGVAVLHAIGLAAGLAVHGLRPHRGGRATDELRHGLPLLALRATGVGYRQLDRVVLGIVVGAVAVSGYDVADKVNLAGLTVLGVATSALIPAAASHRARAPDRLPVLAGDATRWSALVAAPFVGLALGAAEPIGRILAGTDLPGAPAAVRWLALATAVAFVYAAAFEMTIGTGSGRRLVPAALAGLGLNLVATVLLARRFGLPGSAAATFLATVAVAVPVLRACGPAVRLGAPGLVRAAVPGVGLCAATGVVAWSATGVLGDTPALALAVGGAAALTLVVLGRIWRRRPPVTLLAREVGS